MTAETADVVVAALNRFADLVNRGEMPAALACFADDAAIIEDLAPFHWRGPGAGGAWLAAMAANAERHGIVGIEMRFRAPETVLVEAGRAYVVLPGDLTYTPAKGPARTTRGHATFVARLEAGDWRIETLNWGQLGGG